MTFLCFGTFQTASTDYYIQVSQEIVAEDYLISCDITTIFTTFFTTAGVKGDHRGRLVEDYLIACHIIISLLNIMSHYHNQASKDIIEDYFGWLVGSVRQVSLLLSLLLSFVILLYAGVKLEY